MTEASMLDAKKSLPLYLYEQVGPDPSTVVKQSDVARMIAAVRRARWFIWLCVGVFVSLAVVYLAVETPLYDASSEIIIDTVTSKLMQNQDSSASAEGADTIDSNLVDSEVEVLTSDGFARRVIRSLGLVSDPEFVGPPNRLIPWAINLAVTTLNKGKSLVGLKSADLDDPEQRASIVFASRLKVKRSALTYVIAIDFSSDDRDKAAKIANGVANTYLETVLEAKYAAARGTGEWLQSRLTEMRKQAKADDRAVEEFKTKNNIVDTNRGLMNEQQLSDLNSQLVLAKAATAEARAKLDNAHAVMADPDGVSTISDALTNPVIARLRAQYLDLSNHAGDLTKRFGANHGTVLSLNQQMNQIRISIREELKRIAQSYESDYDIALARESSLKASLNGMVSDSGSSNLAQVTLKDLESSSDTSRALLNGYLQKVQEAAQLQTFPISDARVITEAVSPLKPANPKAWLVILIGVVGGIGMGAGVACARELATNSFRTGEELEAATGLKFLGFLPSVTAKNSGRRVDATESGVGFRNPVDVYVADAPFSRFAETIRSVKIAVDGLSPASRGGKVVGVLSAAPNEGKTTVSSNLAASIAVNSNRTLLIDCDVRTCGLSSRIAPNASIGLLEVIADIGQLDAAILVDERTGMCVLPCIRAGKTFQSAEVLGGEAMKALLERVRSRFDYVIIDLAPAVPVVDARAMAQLIDGFILVIRWADTDRKMVQEAISMDGINVRLMGAVLSQVDSKLLREFESYRGKNAHKYYLD